MATLNTVSYNVNQQDTSQSAYILRQEQYEERSLSEYFAYLQAHQEKQFSYTIFSDQTAQRLLAEYANLSNNWDGYGALSIPQSVISNAKSVLNLISSASTSPDTYPNSNGTISLDWDAPRVRVHLEIGLTQYSLLIKYKNGLTLPISGSLDEFTTDTANFISAVLDVPPKYAPTIADIRYVA